MIKLGNGVVARYVIISIYGRRHAPRLHCQSLFARGLDSRLMWLSLDSDRAHAGRLLFLPTTFLAFLFFNNNTFTGVHQRRKVFATRYRECQYILGKLTHRQSTFWRSIAAHNIALVPEEAQRDVDHVVGFTMGTCAESFADRRTIPPDGASIVNHVSYEDCMLTCVLQRPTHTARRAL